MRKTGLILLVGMAAGFSCVERTFAQGGVKSASPESAFKKSAKTTAVIITANAKDAMISAHGLAVGRVGEQIEAEPGPNEFQVLAQGFGARTLRVFVGGNGLLRVSSRLAPARTGAPLYPEPPEAPEEGSKNFGSVMATRPSVCQSLPRIEGFCSRAHWLDDVDFAGFTWNLSELESLSPPEKDTALEAWRRRAQSLGEKSYWGLEQVFANQPGNQLVYQLLALAALRRGECQRVYQIGYDADSLGMLSPELLTMSALCKEVSGDLAAAQSELNLAEKSKRLLTEVMFHQARLTLRESKTKGLAALGKCLKMAKGNLPCEELSRGLSLKPMTDAEIAKAVQRFRATNSSRFSEAFSDLWRDLELERYAQAEVRIGLLGNEYRPSFEIAWAGLYLQAKQGVQLDEKMVEAATRFGEPFNPAVATRVFDYVDKLGQPWLTRRMLMPLLAWQPGEIKGWVRLVELNIQAKEWDLCLQSAERAEKNLTTPSNRLLSYRVQCFLELNRFDEALALLREARKRDPSSWKSAYNLGAALERAGKVEEALGMFRDTIKLSPPEDIRIRLEEKIELDAKRKRKAQGQAPVDPNAIENSPQRSLPGLPPPAAD